MIDVKKWISIQRRMRAILLPTCQQIINILKEEGELPVLEIQIKIRRSQPYTSYFLKKLKEAQIVRTHRQKKYIYYALLEEELNRIDNLIAEI